MKRNIVITSQHARIVKEKGGEVTFKPVRGGKDNYKCNQLKELGET